MTNRRVLMDNLFEHYASTETRISPTPIVRPLNGAELPILYLLNNRREPALVLVSPIHRELPPWSCGMFGLMGYKISACGSENGLVLVENSLACEFRGKKGAPVLAHGHALGW